MGKTSQFRRKIIEHDGKLIDTAAGPNFFFFGQEITTRTNDLTFYYEDFKIKLFQAIFFNAYL